MGLANGTPPRPAPPGFAPALPGSRWVPSTPDRREGLSKDLFLEVSVLSCFLQQLSSTFPSLPFSNVWSHLFYPLLSFQSSQAVSEILGLCFFPEWIWVCIFGAVHRSDVGPLESRMSPASPLRCPCGPPEPSGLPAPPSHSAASSR